MLIELYNLYKAFADDRFPVYYMTPLILLVTYVSLFSLTTTTFATDGLFNFKTFWFKKKKVLVLFFNHYERLRGLRSSSLLFCFWGLLTLCSTVTFRTNLLSHIHFVSLVFLQRQTTTFRRIITNNFIFNLRKITRD